MNDERRHKCAYCGKKRIERRMIRVYFFSNDSIYTGSLWACWFESYSQTNKDCAARYYDQRANDFYASGDKMKSAASKLRKYNKSIKLSNG